MPRKPTRAKQLGVTDAEYERLLAAQGGHCALCPNVQRTRRLHVDHDHATGKVRGLLCYVCNKYLPASRDAAWHRRAAGYLEDAALAARAEEILIQRCIADCAVRPDYLDAAADIFAVAKVYDDQGDPDLLRRVEARIIRDGYTVEQVRERVREKANAAISGAGNSRDPSL